MTHVLHSPRHRVPSVPVPSQRGCVGDDQQGRADHPSAPTVAASLSSSLGVLARSTDRQRRRKDESRSAWQMGGRTRPYADFVEKYRKSPETAHRLP